MFRTMKQIHEGERIPRFYGIAYADPCCLRFICYPVPLNIIVHWVREFWIYLIHWHPSKRENVELLNRKIRQLEDRNIDLLRQLDAAKKAFHDLFCMIRGA